MTVPHGFPQLIAAYGDPRPYVDDKAAWERKTLVTLPLPVPLPYAYVQSAEVTRLRAHTLVASLMVEALTTCLVAGVPRDRLVYGGVYAWRPIRGGVRLSTHAWGVALDLDPARNPLGRPWRPTADMLPATVIDVFEGLGFCWGGRFERPDAQHFQLCAGY
jgi:hypothetical protein